MKKKKEKIQKEKTNMNKMQKLVYPERSKYFHKDIEKIKKIIIKTYERQMLLRKDQSKERNETRWMHKCESLCKRKIQRK